MNIIDANWTQTGERDPRAYSRRCRRKRALRRDLALLALVIIIMVGAECLANYLVPPVKGDAAEYVAAAYEEVT